MINYTQNFHLAMPDDMENVRISDLNSNMQIIDANLGGGVILSI